MLILAIESSCDDTSVALVKATRGKFEILKELTASQIDIHKKYGGVVPEIAGRMHAEKIMPLIEEVLGEHSPPIPLLLREGGIKPDVICVTSGPGLITGLLVGVEAAKTLSYLWNVPLVGVNHIEGHIHSVEIQNPKSKILNNNQIQNSKQLPITNYQLPKIKFPALCLIASGGHTELILMKDHGKYKKLGATLDDAAGECFDKVAKLLGLEYPGGPKISLNAQTGNPQAIKFPRPMLKEDNLNFSFAGLKTSALYWLRDNAKKQVISYKLQVTSLDDFCASFEQAIIDVLVGKTLKAAQKYQPKTIILGGGVAANKKLRETLAEQIAKLIPYSLFLTPSTKYCMDNAAMIAIAGYYHAKKKEFVKWNKIQADPNWEIK